MLVGIRNWFSRESLNSLCLCAFNGNFRQPPSRGNVQNTHNSAAVAAKANNRRKMYFNTWKFPPGALVQKQHLPELQGVIFVRTSTSENSLDISWQPFVSWIIRTYCRTSKQGRIPIVLVRWCFSKGLTFNKL